MGHFLGQRLLAICLRILLIGVIGAPFTSCRPVRTSVSAISSGLSGDPQTTGGQGNDQAAVLAGLKGNLNFTSLPQNKSDHSRVGHQYVVRAAYKNSKLYLGTWGGLSISSDQGVSFLTRTASQGLGGNRVNDLFVEGNIVLTATNGGVSISEDGGTTFRNVRPYIKATNSYPIGLNEALSAVAYFGGKIFVSTLLQTHPVLMSSDMGQTFTDVAGVTNATPAINQFHVWNGGLYAATSFQGVLKYDLAQNRFVPFASTAQGLADPYVKWIHGSGTTLYAATVKGLSISTDNGQNFPTLRLADTVVASVYSQGSKIFITGNNFGAKWSSDGGMTFTDYAGLSSSPYGHFTGDSGSMIFYASTGGGLYISSDGGTTFAQKTTDVFYNTVHAILVDGQKIFMATHETGDLVVSNDGGGTFAKLPISGSFGPNMALAQDSQGNIFLGNYQGVFKSSDQGSSFSRLRLMNNAGAQFGAEASVLQLASGGSYLYVAATGNQSSGSGYFFSSDGGATFSNPSVCPNVNCNFIFDVALVKESNGTSFNGTVFVGTGYGLYVSRDYGQTFTQATTTLGTPGSNGAIVTAVGTYGLKVAAGRNRLGVWLSSNGGQTFVQNTTPILNTAYVQKIVYVSESTILAATEVGLWLSTDGGASFKVHLPESGVGDNMTSNLFLTAGKLYLGSGQGLQIANFP